MGVPGRILSRASLSTSLSPFLGPPGSPSGHPPLWACSPLPKSGDIRLFFPLELRYFVPHCRPLTHPGRSRGPGPLDRCLLLPPPSSPAQALLLVHDLSRKASLLQGNDRRPQTHAHLLRWIHNPLRRAPGRGWRRRGVTHAPGEAV